MKRFKKVLESALGNTSLKQIVIKVDPKNKSDIENSSEYTGYVLEENPEGITMYVVRPEDIEGGNIMSMPGVSTCSNDNHLAKLIGICRDTLIESGVLDGDDPQLRGFDSIQDVDQLVGVLKQYGFEDCEVLSVFMSFFDNVEVDIEPECDEQI
jgi:hypothetical protein